MVTKEQAMRVAARNQLATQILAVLVGDKELTHEGMEDRLISQAFRMADKVVVKIDESYVDLEKNASGLALPQKSLVKP
jgi:hypothetical protein